VRRPQHGPSAVDRNIIVIDIGSSDDDEPKLASQQPAPKGESTKTNPHQSSSSSDDDVAELEDDNIPAVQEGGAKKSIAAPPQASSSETNNNDGTDTTAPSERVHCSDDNGNTSKAAAPAIQQHDCSEHSFVESVEKYIGPPMMGATNRAAAVLSRSNYVSLTNEGGGAAETDPWKSMPHRAPPKRKYNDAAFDWVDLGSVEYNPNAFTEHNGRLKKRDFSVVSSATAFPKAKRLYPDATAEDWLPDGATLPFIRRTGSPSASAATRAQRSREKLEMRKNEDEVNEIRVGDDYQAFVEDRPSYEPSRDSSNRKDIGGGAVMLYDPILADAARERGEAIDTFLARGVDFNVKMLLMQALHTSGYRVESAVQEFNRLYRENPYFSVSLNESQQAHFDKLCRSGLIGRQKDFRAAAEKMGVRKETIMVNYYRWKSEEKSMRLYKEMKDERNEDSHNCEVCDDGGMLIVCENCHKAYHLECLVPPLATFPKDDWYCKRCIHQSPCKLRRLSGQCGATPNRSPRRNSMSDNERSSSRRRLVMGEPTEAKRPSTMSTEVRESLKSVFKDIKPRAGDPSAAERRPAGMIRDTSSGRWILPPGHEENTESKAESDDELAAADDYRSLSQESKSDDDDSAAKAPAQKKTKYKTSPASSASSAYQSDSDFDEGDIDKDDDDDVSVTSTCLKSSTPGPKKRGLMPSALSRSPGGTRELYYVYLPVVPEGLMISVNKISRKHGLQGAVFAGYRQSSSGGQGYAERQNAFKAQGDEFMEVDGIACKGKSFQEIIGLLKSVTSGVTFKVFQMAHDPTGAAKAALEKVIASPSRTSSSPVKSPAGSSSAPSSQGMPNARRSQTSALPSKSQAKSQSPQPASRQTTSPSHAMQQPWQFLPPAPMQGLPMPMHGLPMQSLGWFQRMQQPFPPFASLPINPQAAQAPLATNLAANPNQQALNTGIRHISFSSNQPSALPVRLPPVPAQQQDSRRNAAMLPSQVEASVPGTAPAQQQDNQRNIAVLPAQMKAPALAASELPGQTEGSSSLALMFGKQGGASLGNGQHAGTATAESTDTERVNLTPSDLVPFLKGLGISTCEEFLKQNLVSLSKLFAEERGIDESVALEFLGTARLIVRKSQEKN